MAERSWSYKMPGAGFKPLTFTLLDCRLSSLSHCHSLRVLLLFGRGNLLLYSNQWTSEWVPCFISRALFDSSKYGVEFPGKSYFTGKAKFQKNQISLKTNLFGKFNFPGSQISGKSNFREVEFPGKSNFREVKFPGKSNFPGSQISWKVKFPGKSIGTPGRSWYNLK